MNKTLNIMKFWLAAPLLLLLFSLTTLAQTEREKGIELYRQGDYQAALETLQKLVSVKDKDQDLWLVVGMSFARLNDAKKAKDAFKKADKYSVKQLAGNEKEAKILAKPRAYYTDQARAGNEQGKVKLALELGADGKIKFVFPFRTLRFGLTEEALAAVRNIKFEPAVKDGKNVSTIAIVEYQFMLY
jgi:tetratricopeptide (TPR) repeat protein